MATYSQTPLRIAANLISDPPLPLRDANTGKQPRFWRAQNVGIAFGAFDGSGVPLDLANLASLQLTLQKTQDSLLPAFAPVVVDAADITDSITVAGWQAGQSANAIFSLTKAQLDLSLNGEASADYWLIIVGTTTDAETIIYSAGFVTIYNPGNGLPLPPFGYVSRNDQTLTAGDITVSPTSLDHTEIITVDGAARTSNVILSTVGMKQGALCRIRWGITATPDIVVDTKNATVDGTTLQSFSSAIFPNGLDLYSFDEANATWDRIQSQYPAT